MATSTPIPDHLRCEMLNALGVRCSRAEDHRGITGIDCRFEMPSNEAIERVLAAEREKVLGTVAEGEVLVLRIPAGMGPGQEFESLARSMPRIPISVVLVPPGWTREQVDAEVVRVAHEAGYAEAIAKHVFGTAPQRAKSAMAIDRMRALLRELEWSGVGQGSAHGCPTCGAASPIYRDGGQHAPDCRLAALLKEGT